MSRRRRPPSRGRGAPGQLLDAWPLDQPTPAPAPDPEPAPAATVQPEPRSAPDPAELPARAGNDHYCRRCGATGDGPIPPPGWLRLQRRGSGERDSWRPWQTIGVYCGVACLVAEATG